MPLQIAERALDVSEEVFVVLHDVPIGVDHCHSLPSAWVLPDLARSVIVPRRPGRVVARVSTS
jgi:hypothetical protein